jgi:IS30 family transposase
VRVRKASKFLTESEQHEVRELRKAGFKMRWVCELYDVSMKTVALLGSARRMRESQGVRSPLRLSPREREEISRGVRAEETARGIARRLKRSPSTISREIIRTGGRGLYRGWRGENLAAERALRPKPRKLETRPNLRREVERCLADLLSPEQISAQLVTDFPDDPFMRVSHETIYQSLYVQGRGAFRKELTKCLRTGRAQRRANGRPKSKKGRIKDMVMISERPPEVEDRAVPGHWEGDLIIGRNQASAIGTLVERTSRYLILLHLPDGRTAQHVLEALVREIMKLPEHLRLSLTWDQGKELSEHIQFKVQTGVQVYFCDPHSPWQRGSNENTNGLLRQYFPKQTDLSVYGQPDLNRVARQMNRRPRQTLGWMTPSQVLERAVATTA